MDVTIIIPNWNGEDILPGCIDSILAHTTGVDYEIIIVDNGSTDGSVALIERYVAEHSHIHAIYNAENLFFAKPCNQGYEVSIGKYVIIANNDILLQDNAVAQLAAYAAAHPSVGIVSPIFTDEDGTTVQGFYRRFPRIWHIFVTYVKLGRGIDKYLLGRALQGRYFYRDRTFQGIEEIEEAGASFNLIKREVIDKIGFLFDECFSLLFNDVDLYKRVYACGYVSHVVGDVKVIHFGSVASNKQPSRVYKQMFYEGVENYFHKYHRLEYWLLYLIFPELGIRKLGKLAGRLFM